MSTVTCCPRRSSFADGVSRVAYSTADLTARAWIIDELKQAEIVPRIDAAGNIYGRFGGQPKHFLMQSRQWQTRRRYRPGLDRSQCRQGELTRLLMKANDIRANHA